MKKISKKRNENEKINNSNKKILTAFFFIFIIWTISKLKLFYRK
jgi:hypothetical protein